MTPIKFTDEEMAEIRMLATKVQEKIFQFGQFRVERINLLRSVKALEEREAKTEEEFVNLEKLQTSLMDKLTAKYGEGTLNPVDGTFLPSASVTQQKQNATA